MEPELRIAVLPAFRLGGSPLYFERSARLEWYLCESDNVGPLPDHLQRHAAQIEHDLQEVDEVLSDRTLFDLRDRFCAAASYAWAAFREAWDSEEHRRAIEYQNYDWHYDREGSGFEPDVVEHQAPFGKGAWADLHREADRYHRTLPTPLSLCASLGADIAAVRWYGSFPGGDPSPPGVTGMPAVRVGERLALVAEHIPTLSGLAVEFGEEVGRRTKGHATALDPEWVVPRVRDLHAQIVRHLQPAQLAGLGRIFVGTKAGLNKAFGKSAHYTGFLRGLQNSGKIKFVELVDKRYRVEVIDAELLALHGTKLAEFAEDGPVPS